MWALGSVFPEWRMHGKVGRHRFEKIKRSAAPVAMGQKEEKEKRDREKRQRSATRSPNKKDKVLNKNIYGDPICIYSYRTTNGAPLYETTYPFII